MLTTTSSRPKASTAARTVAAHVASSATLPGVITPAQPGGPKKGNFYPIPCRFNRKWVLGVLCNREAEGGSGPLPPLPELAALDAARHRAQPLGRHIGQGSLEVGSQVHGDHPRGPRLQVEPHRRRADPGGRASDDGDLAVGINPIATLEKIHY